MLLWVTSNCLSTAIFLISAVTRLCQLVHRHLIQILPTISAQAIAFKPGHGFCNAGAAPLATVGLASVTQGNRGQSSAADDTRR